MRNDPVEICFVLLEGYPYFNPSSGQMTGGAELQLFYLSTELAKKSNYDVNFIVGNYGQPEKEIVKGVKLLKSFNAERNDGVFKKINHAIRFLRILKREKPDVILSTTNNTLVVLCSIYAKLSKARHIHRIAHNKDTGFDRKKEFGYLARLYSWGMKRADIVLVQNKEQQKQLLMNFTKNSILFRNVFEVKSQVHIEKKYVLWVSRYQKWKQPDLFIKLAKNIPDEEFLMICPPPQGNEVKNWQKLKQNAKHLVNLQFIDYVSFSDIQAYFDQASVFVNTSKAEGFPNTFLQAAQGRAAIVSLIVNPDNFITKFDCGVSCNNNFELMVEQLRGLLNNKSELLKKGENCYNYLKENHDLEVVRNQLITIINSLL